MRFKQDLSSNIENNNFDFNYPVTIFLKLN